VYLEIIQTQNGKSNNIQKTSLHAKLQNSNQSSRFTPVTALTRTSAALISFFVSPVGRLFEGGAYLKGSYHKDKTTSRVFFMAYRFEANLSFGFHNSLVNTFLQVFNISLDVNVLTVAETSQDLTQDALYLSL